MGDLIVRNTSYQRVPFSKESDVIKYEMFDCVNGWRTSSTVYGKNEFMLKVKLNAGDLIPTNYYICYGAVAEFAGQISERTIDLSDNTVTYYGVSIHRVTTTRQHRYISSAGFTTESYTAQTRTFDSSQMPLIIDTYVQGTAWTRKNKTEILPPTALDANLGDTIKVTDKQYNVTAQATLYEIYLKLDKNGEHYEYTLG